MSGGVDSSVAAALLKEQGWQVKGLHFLLPAPAIKRTERQNSVRRVEERLKIPVSYVRLEDVFTKRVIEPFVEAYLKGLTPNPCAVCNPLIKFDHLLRQADEEGIAFVATGHYAVVGRPENLPAELRRGAPVPAGFEPYKPLLQRDHGNLHSAKGKAKHDALGFVEITGGKS